MNYGALSVECVIPPLSLQTEEETGQGWEGKKRGEKEKRDALVSNLDGDTGDYRRKGLIWPLATAERVALGGSLEMRFQNWCEKYVEWGEERRHVGGGKQTTALDYVVTRV